MTGPNDRAKRVVRVCTVQHRVAQQQLAQAHRDARQIGSVADRIGALRETSVIMHGRSDGPSLGAMSEWSARLDAARQAIAVPLDQALRQIERRQAGSAQAQFKLDRANQLLEKINREMAANAEQRTSSARSVRPATIAGARS